MDNQQEHIYTVDIYNEIERFRQYHQGYANLQAPAHVQEYTHMLVEQMIAHFEYEQTAVQSFIAHYVNMITDPNVSPLFMYHPLKFLRQMENQGYQDYVQCLFGFATEMLRLFLSHRLYTDKGVLLASYQHIENDTLYLIIRPEAPDVFLY